MGRLAKDPPASEITPEGLYMRRREFVRNAVLFTATSAGVGGSLLWLMRGGRAEPKPARPTGSAPDLPVARRGAYRTARTRTPRPVLTKENNFYDFGAPRRGA